MAESIGKLFLGIKKRKEELETENNNLKSRNTELEEKVLLLQHKINGYERHNRIHAETHHISDLLYI